MVLARCPNSSRVTLPINPDQDCRPDPSQGQVQGPELCWGASESLGNWSRSRPIRTWATRVAGGDVTLLSRSGSGPELPGGSRIVFDASDVDALTAAATGASALFICANPGTTRPGTGSSRPWPQARWGRPSAPGSP